MSNPSTALFHRAMRLLLARDMPGFIALFADDGVMEFPFAPAGQPNRIVHYRDYWNPQAAQDLLGGGLVRS
ncbi:hypothetical protein [Micromonospora matsumotoense]|uniref:hypothetical protein n=1 Tax=Micromonospora matsumotoense TaxID=121616 RepID=UPI0033E89D4D